MAELDSDLIEAFTLTYLWPHFDAPSAIPDFHREIWAAFSSEAAQVVRAAPRGHGKSTSITKAWLLAGLLFRAHSFALIVSKGHDVQVVEFIRSIRSTILYNDDICKTFGIKTLLKDSQDDIIVQMKDGYEFRVTGLSSEQNPRGIKWNDRRFDLILFDDIEGKEERESEIAREKLKVSVTDDFMPAGSPDCKFRMIGTVGHYDSVLETCLNDPLWNGKRYSAHKSYSDFSEILWPERFPEKKLRAIQKRYAKNPDGYSREYLNIPQSDEDGFFKKSDFLDIEEHRRKMPKVYYIGGDLAISTKAKANRTAFAVGGFDEEGVLSIEKMVVDRFDSKENVDNLFILHKNYTAPLFVLEEEQIMRTIKPFLEQEILKRRKFLRIQYMRPVKDKGARARAFQAMVRSGMVRFDKQAPWWPELEQELRRFLKWDQDDQVDALGLLGMALESMAFDLDVDYRDQEYDNGMDNEEESYEDWFSRQTGVSRITGY